jgi:hypothetical protein
VAARTLRPETRSVYRAVAGEPDGWNAYAFFTDPDGNGWVLQQSPRDA